MMLRNLVIAAIAAMLPIAAGALTLTINGETFTVNSVDVSTSASGVKITTNPVIDLGTGGGGDSGGDSGGGGGGDGDGDGDSGGGTGGGASCGTVPAGVTLATPIEKWHGPGGQTRNALGSETKSFKFTTTNNPAYAGQVAVTHTTQNPTVKTIWISECPGDPISSVASQCVKDGKEGVVVRWAQNPGSRLNCALQTNKTYYINVKNAAKDNSAVSTCTSNNCPFFMIIYTNQQP